MTPALLEQLDRVSMLAKESKNELCAEEDGIADLNAIVVVQQGDEYMCSQSGIEGNPVDNLPDHLQHIFDAGLRTFDSISFITDTYMRKADLMKTAEEIAESYERGALRNDFTNNPFSDVTEGLAVLTVMWDDIECGGRFVEYKYNDNGKPVYTDLTDHDDKDPKGRMAFILTKFVDFMQRVVHAEATGDMSGFPYMEQ